VHALASLALLASGLLLELPDLRARLVGGYGREILQVHLWASWVFLGSPALGLILVGRPLLRDFLRRFVPPHATTWRRVHLGTTLAATSLFGVSGLLLWLDVGLPLALADAALALHMGLTWLLLVLLPAHLFAARDKIAARVRGILLGSREPQLEFRLGFDQASERHEPDD
jgi:hypothetical protein